MFYNILKYTAVTSHLIIADFQIYSQNFLHIIQDKECLFSIMFVNINILNCSEFPGRVGSSVSSPVSLYLCG